MSTNLSPKVTILDVSTADVDQGDAVWYTVEGSDKVLIFITISGSITVGLDLDVNGDASKIVSLGTFTSSDEKVLDDPCGRIRAYTTGWGSGDTAVVQIRNVYEKG